MPELENIENLSEIGFQDAFVENAEVEVDQLDGFSIGLLEGFFTLLLEDQLVAILLVLDDLEVRESEVFGDGSAFGEDGENILVGFRDISQHVFVDKVFADALQAVKILESGFQFCEDWLEELMPL